MQLVRFFPILKRLPLLGIMVVLLLSPTVHALSTKQQKIYDSGILSFDLDTGGSCGSSSADIELSGSDNYQKAFNFFVAAGLSEAQAAAVVGNLIQESSVVPTKIQGGKLSENPDDAGSGGWGIVQWTPGSKVVGIAKDLGITGPIYELSTQLQIVLGEMKDTSPTGVKDVFGKMQKITGSDPTEATQFFEENFEGAGKPNMANRIAFAKKVLADYGGEGSISGGGVVGTNASCGSVGAVNCSATDNATPPETGSLSQVRQNVVCLAKAELALWESGTLHTGGSEPYSFYKYSEGQNQEWCADFASWIYNQAGYPIGDGKNWRVPSVDGIQQVGEKGVKFEYHDAGSYTPKPGDIAVYKVGMSHVNIVVSINQNKSTMTVIGGNQSGTSTANSSSKVSQYDTSSSGGHGLSGFVSPKD